MFVGADGLAGLRRFLVENAQCIMRSGVGRIHTQRGLVLALGLGMGLLLGVEVAQVVMGLGKVGRYLKRLLVGHLRLLEIVLF